MRSASATRYAISDATAKNKSPAKAGHYDQRRHESGRTPACASATATPGAAGPGFATAPVRLVASLTAERQGVDRAQDAHAAVC